MAVQRQQNWLGQQRADIPHLRALESSVAHDFDVLGQLATARLATVIRGFTFLKAGAIGADAEDLVLQVAGSMVIHYEATEAGSLFRVEDGRANETLGPTNTRVRGSFTPGTTNYVGLDLVRTADDSTADSVQFLNPSANVERARTVPLARSMDYRIVVSTDDFSSTRGVCPIALIVTDASNRVVSITDARYLMFRLGAGGSSPSAVSPFNWPGGRNESDPGTADIAGDRSIFSLKEWLAAAMTRIWESGGGEFWYSLTADRNVNMSSSDRFDTTLEPFFWDGTNLFWQQLVFSFDNSTAVKNVVAEQVDISPGLTDLADGECVYVDLDRTQTVTVNAHKAVLRTLGGSTRPGQRWVLAWRIGAEIYYRGQDLALGVEFSPATTAVRGLVRLTANPVNAGEIADPKVVLGVIVSGSPIATAGGLSHNEDFVTAGQWPSGPNIIEVGRGIAAGDSSVVLSAEAPYNVLIQGTQNWSASDGPALQVLQNDSGADPARNRTAIFSGRGLGVHPQDAHHFEVGGALGFRNAPVLPQMPTPTTDSPIRSKLFFQTNGLDSPFTRDLLCVMWFDGSVTPIATGPSY